MSEIESICTIIGKTQEDLFISYKLEKFAKELNITFLEWLKQKIDLQNLKNTLNLSDVELACRKIGKPQEDLFVSYKLEKFAKELDITFLEWLNQIIEKDKNSLVRSNAG